LKPQTSRLSPHSHGSLREKQAGLFLIFCYKKKNKEQTYYKIEFKAFVCKKIAEYPPLIRGLKLKCKFAIKTLSYPV